MFENIIGYETVKNELLKIYDIMVNRSNYERFNIPIPNGIILYGEPGVGKTLCVTELIKASGRPSFTVRRDTDSNGFMEYLKSAFVQAKQNAPSIVFLDDMDKFGNGGYDSPEYNAIQTGIDECKGYDVFIIATTNSLCFPNSLLRPGRFDRKIFVEIPYGQESVDIINYYMQGKMIDNDVNINIVANMLDGYSCATLETVINMAGLYAGYEKSSTIKMKHIVNSILSVIHDKPETVFKDDYKYLVNIAYHEAGHIVVSEVLRPGSVTLATIRKTGLNDNAFVSSRSRIEIEPDVLNRIRVNLAGKAAIELKFGICDIGCANDLNNAISSFITLIGDNAYCGFETASYFNCTSFTYQNVETKALQEIGRLYEETKNILIQNWTFLELVTMELLKKETLISTDIDNIKYCLGLQ